jgi:hypothetical protein
MNKKIKLYFKLLLIVLVLTMSIGLSYKIGTMHSFFQTTAIFAGSELICNETMKTTNDTRFENGSCYFGKGDTCFNLKGINHTKFCTNETLTFRNQYESVVIFGRTLEID